MSALALFVLLSTAAFANGAADTKVFEIPRYEAEQVIADWLKHGGFEVERTAGADAVVLHARKKGSQWEIALRHNTPLATRVSVDCAPRGDAGDLWKFLSGYLQGYATNHGGPVKDTPAAVGRRMASVVCIRAVASGRPVQLTGFVADRSGLILCTAHTLQKPQELRVILSDGSSLEGRLVKIDFLKDLALIDCSHAFADAVSLEKPGAVPDMGRRVYSIGCPLDHRNTVSSGYVDGPPRLVEGLPLIQVRMTVDPGSSGSPVFDKEGNLVAMVKGRLKGDRLSGLLIPVETIISFIKER